MEQALPYPTPHVSTEVHMHRCSSGGASHHSPRVWTYNSPYTASNLKKYKQYSPFLIEVHLNSTQFYSILIVHRLNSTQFSSCTSILLNSTQSYSILLNSTEFYLILFNSTQSAHGPRPHLFRNVRSGGAIRSGYENLSNALEVLGRDSPRLVRHSS